MNIINKMQIAKSKPSLFNPLFNPLFTPSRNPYSATWLSIGGGEEELPTIPYPNPYNEPNPFPGGIPPQLKVLPYQPPQNDDDDPPWWEKWWWVIALGVVCVVVSVGNISVSNNRKKGKAVVSGSM